MQWKEYAENWVEGDVSVPITQIKDLLVMTDSYGKKSYNFV